MQDFDGNDDGGTESDRYPPQTPNPKPPETDGLAQRFLGDAGRRTSGGMSGPQMTTTTTTTTIPVMQAHRRFSRRIRQARFCSSSRESCLGTGTQVQADGQLALARDVRRTKRLRRGTRRFAATLPSVHCMCSDRLARCEPISSALHATSMLLSVITPMISGVPIASRCPRGPAVCLNAQRGRSVTQVRCPPRPTRAALELRSDRWCALATVQRAMLHRSDRTAADLYTIRPAWDGCTRAHHATPCHAAGVALVRLGRRRRR